VDVFTERALEGNALAVFPDARGLDDITMQKIARELNLSETVFVLPASRADCLVNARIFTPSREMIFAGHPTIGTGFVLVDEGIVPAGSDGFALEEKVGPVPVRIERGARPLIWLRTPAIEFGRTYDAAVCAEALGLRVGDLAGLAPQFVTAGNPTIFVPLRDPDAVDRASLDLAGFRRIAGVAGGPLCVFVFAPVANGAYSRMFAPEYGIVEDPATGSSTGPLAAFMIRHGLATGSDGSRWISEQGARMGRRSLLHVLIHGEQGMDGIEVGGYVTPLVEARMTLG
jgi:trans-2,3-dihydro-3-hydroxyanthranilate isomerase